MSSCDCQRWSPTLRWSPAQRFRSQHHQRLRNPRGCRWSVPVHTLTYRGVHPPETMMHFPPVSDFPLFSENFQTLRKIFTILPFPEKFLHFHPPKFLMTFSFFSHRP